MLTPGARVVVAVSGGADSTALLSLLVQLQPVYNLTLMVAHVNHQLRGEESEREALFVEQQAMRLNLAFYQTRLDITTLRSTSKLSVQQAARALRYRYFEHLYHSLRATSIALGHTADDQAETLFLRLLRGGGPGGVAGIPPVRHPFIRPLITVSRHVILTYLHTECIPWAEDSSNAHPIYLRNRVRHQIMPLVRQFNPQIIRRLTQLADVLQADHQALERQVDCEANAVLTWKADKLVDIDYLAWRAVPLAIQRRLLRRILERLRIATPKISFRHIERLRQFLTREEQGKRLDLPGGIAAEYLTSNTVRLRDTDDMPLTHQSYVLSLPGSVDLVQLNIRIHADIQEKPESFAVSEYTVFLDFGRLAQPLGVRFWQPGDRFHPLGAPGRRKLQDFYVDSRIPRGERPYVPLVVSGKDLVWIVGHRIAETYKIRPETTCVVRLHCSAIQQLSVREGSSTEIV